MSDSSIRKRSFSGVRVSGLFNSIQALMAVLDELEALLLPRVLVLLLSFCASKIYTMAQFVGWFSFVLVVEFY